MPPNRRSKYTVFVKDDALYKMDHTQKMEVWDFLQLLFPDDHNKIQFDLANTFMRQLLNGKLLTSQDIRANFKGTEYQNLMGVVLPKLERFGLIKITGERGKGKTYQIGLDETFSNRIRHLSMEWYRICVKYEDLSN